MQMNLLMRKRVPMQNTKSSIFFALFLLLLPLLGYSQPTIFLDESFTQAGIPNGWSIQELNMSSANWRWKDNGQADQGLFWGNRQSIASTSGGGAMVFDSDGFISGQAPPIGAPHQSALVTPVIDLSGTSRVGLRFYQYYRNYQSVTSIGISTQTDIWTDIPINGTIGLGVETTNGNLITMDISALAANESNVQIRFLFEGANFFWIVDDVQVLELPDTYEETFPPELGDSLTNWGIPYLVDSLGGAFPPNELVVEWVPGLPENSKDSVRQEFQVIQYDTCTCSDLELWTFADTLSVSGVNLIQNGDFTEGFSGNFGNMELFCECFPGTFCVDTAMSDKCNNSDWVTNDFMEFTDPGNGQFAIIQGRNDAPSNVFCFPVNLAPNENYLFSFRGRSLQNSFFPDMQLSIDGTTISSIPVQTISAFGNWALYFFTFTAPPAGAVQVCLQQTNFSANDYGYGIDDLFLGTLDLDSLTNGTIQEKQDRADVEAGEIEESDFNYYNFDIEEIADGSTFENLPFPVDINTPANDTDDVVIAILDTGVDYNYDYLVNSGGITQFDLNPYIWNTTPNCNDTDEIGWNFIHRNDITKQNKPFDDHSHGTHVAGIMAQQWLQLNDDCCNFRILPVKTHNSYGLGKLFDVSCGIYYSALEGANFINASWGFTAVQDPDSGILYNAIDFAKDSDVLLITSAGNTRTNLEITPNYPSNYNLDNIITVGALDTIQPEQFWPQSNYSDQYVHYAAAGVDIQSSVPPLILSGFWAPKSGTSMAAPVVTANAAIISCLDGVNTMQDIKDKLFDTGRDLDISLDSFSINDKAIETAHLLTMLNGCMITATNEELLEQLDWQLFPNPTTGMVQMTLKELEVQVRAIQLFNALGQPLQSQLFEQFQREISLNFDLTKYPSGVYQIVILTENGTASQGIVKHK